MMLSEALSIAPLSSGRIVAGESHTNQEISWVQVVDHPDIVSWVKPGHLLLSTGYNWPKSDDQASAMVDKLAAKGVCGVVLAVPHFLEHFPAASVCAAEHIGLSLIEIPWEVPFSEITQAVHRELVDQQGRALARSEQIHRELTETAVSGHSLNDVAQVLGRVLDRRVSIHSTDGNVLGSHAPESLNAEATASAAFGAMNDSVGLASVDESSHPVRLVRSARLAKKQEHLVAYTARVRGERAGYVVVAEGETPLSALDLRAVEHAGTVAALLISHQRELSMQAARLGYALVASLIEGLFEENPPALERARILGWNSQTQYRLCTVLLDEPNPLSREGFARREEFASRVGLSLERLAGRRLISLSANQIHILVPDALNIDSWWAQFQPTRMAMAVSQAHAGVDGMRIAGRQTSELIEHLKPGRVHYFEQMLFPRVLSGDADAQRAFVDRLFGSLDEGKRGKHLLETALTLTKEGFHLQRTSERLNVHISTLRYRLGRLSDLTGLDLESVEGRFRLQVGARLFLMREK